ncbi:MAG: ParA family protein [Planctomycetota bacterium]
MASSMRTIALMNQKGGVGKTTTSVNLGAALAERGKKVLLADLDPQAHLTINYGIDPTDGATLYEVMNGEAGLLKAVRVLSDVGLKGGGEIHLLPSSLDLAGIELELAETPGRQMLLKNAIARSQYDYDYVLLDCPPSLGLLTINALALAKEVVIPMQAHFLALQGFAKLLETTQLVGRQINPELSVTGVILTMFDAQTRLGSDVIEELQGFFDAARGQNLPWSDAKLFDTKVRRNIKLAEAPSFGQPIQVYDPQSNGAADYRKLAAEFEGVSEQAEQAQAATEKSAFSNTPIGSAGSDDLEDPTPTVEFVRRVDQPTRASADRASADRASADRETTPRQPTVPA